MLSVSVVDNKYKSVNYQSQKQRKKEQLKLLEKKAGDSKEKMETENKF